MRTAGKAGKFSRYLVGSVQSDRPGVADTDLQTKTTVEYVGYFQCDSGVVVGTPRTLSELQEQVLQYDRVKAVGVGHSWWQQQFCSGNDSNAVNIVLTQINDTLTE